MADVTSLDALQAFHRELLALEDGFSEDIDCLGNDLLVRTFEQELEKLWDCPPRKEQSRNAVKSGKITFNGVEYQVNQRFQQDVLVLSDELDLDELESAKYLLDSQNDLATLGRSLLECAVIRFHQQRKYLLDILRILLQLDSGESDVEEDSALEQVKMFVGNRVFRPGLVGPKRYVPRCMSTMATTRTWLQKLGDKIAAAQALSPDNAMGLSEEMETVEFSRLSLIQQHELLGVIICQCIEKREAQVSDFLDFVSMLEKADKYDMLLIHLIPAIGAYISVFGSTEGACDLIQARELNSKLLPPADDSTWPLPHVHAAFRVWWLAEYSGFYRDDPPEDALPPNTDLDQEDRERTKQFMDALKDGAFDLLLSVAADVTPPDWHDAVRTGMRNWLLRRSTTLPSEPIQFSLFFQQCLMAQLEVFIDAFITNLPDVLRKLRVEEDEQRQLSQAHEQDLDLERFLLIIAYTYEGRPDAALNFWSDPDSNLAGFMQWASRRASTPLVTAFCEMLQAISANAECATAAHEFLLDESHGSSGKMRRALSLTWSQIFKELAFFSDKIKQKPTPAQTVRFRGPKMANEQMETEPESAMMLECYLRLMTKLASESEVARQFLQPNASHSLTAEMLFSLASSPIPPRLRGCVFMTLRALLTRKSRTESHAMWTCLETWVTGGYAAAAAASLRHGQQNPPVPTERILNEMSNGFEDPESFIQLLLALISPSKDNSRLNDSLPFPDNLGSSSRYSGIEIYVDFVVGMVFANKSQEIQDKHQLRMLRLSCLDFMLACLDSFNENLIIIANTTKLNIDSLVNTSDLATYVCKHPFGRVMEWMYNDKVMKALFSTIHQEPADVGNAAPDSPLILGIQRAVEVISRVLDLEPTYQNLVKPRIKLQAISRREPVAHAAYSSFADGLVTRLSLVVDLGRYCGMGYPDVTLACLKLLEKMSASSRIATSWSGSSRLAHRNKAIVALEANGEHEGISRAFVSELMAPLEASREANSPSYLAKLYILDFLLQCLQTTPNEPTIAHLLLGFRCGVDSLSVDAQGAFEQRTSLFHCLLRLLFEIPCGDARGMRQWLITLKCRIMRILRILWSCRLSAPIVVKELRDEEFLFHLVIREPVIQSDLLWEGQEVGHVEFTLTDGAPALVDFLALRSLTLEYIATELCLISQGRMPNVKRRIYEALNGQVMGEDNQFISTPTVFDLYDFLLPDECWNLPPPSIQHHQNLDFSICAEEDADGNIVYNLDLVQNIILLKRNEQYGKPGSLVTRQEVVEIDKERASILSYLNSCNRRRQIAKQCLSVLKSWTRLLLIMVECNDLEGAAQTSFFLQALQAVLPSLDAFASDRPDEALELAKLARVLLCRFDAKSLDSGDSQSQAIGNLVGDKLYQLFQVCLQAIGSWAGSPELRSVYYEICYRYLNGNSEEAPLSTSHPRTSKTIHVYGERLITVICDDAYGSQPACQAAALILLNALVYAGSCEDDDYVIETLNRLNFIGIVVDSLRDIMHEWHHVFTSGNANQQHYQDARLALLLQIAESRTGAKYLVYANVFRTLETSGLFSADPELQSDVEDPRVLEQHYNLLAKVARVIGAAVLSRGSHNANQGRKFLTDHRMLVTHTLKRSAGIGHVETNGMALEEHIGELADAFMVIIIATGFVKYEVDEVAELTKSSRVLFH
ncbi:hypothetical protein CDD81_2627 [Ophiocordyceps australis]|uniref:Uncharacterized protein n=1 Tax=Ophiocordyceps australis TaxID=1399860 RepID=A0A2C5XWG7_9HYPO|nr:hypothetical protein CDD81_2627 [Ophiocordyceps australis]